MRAASLMVRLRTWGREPRTYVIRRTRDDTWVWVVADGKDHYRVLASDANGEPITVVRWSPSEDPPHRPSCE